MNRIPLLIAALAALALAAQTQAMSVPKLKGDVGPGFTIHLKDAKGKTVKTLKPGKYTITVVDKATDHDFKLEGPGLGKGRQITTVTFKGTKTVTVTLKKGTYTYVCTPHRSIPSMKGTFKVK
jgi:plastocyanin